MEQVDWLSALFALWMHGLLISLKTLAGEQTHILFDMAMDQRSWWSDACAVSPFIIVLHCAVAMRAGSHDSAAAFALLWSMLQLLLLSVSTGQGKSSTLFALSWPFSSFTVLWCPFLQVSRSFLHKYPFWLQIGPSKSSVSPVGGMFRVSGSSGQFWALWEVCPSLSVHFPSTLTSVLIISPPNSNLGVKSPWWHDLPRSDAMDALADPFTVSLWCFYRKVVVCTGKV